MEDERIVAMHLKQQLERLGYNVSAMVTTGEQALKQIRDLRPDVVLMDIHIEGDFDGIETASRIPPDVLLPVIYLTAYSEEATLERARATKPYGYLLKPFSERELHASIQMVLERHRADKAARESERRLEQLVAARTKGLLAANQELERQIVARLETERRLHQAQKMEAVGMLTAGIAHDFNNLLTVITGHISHLESELVDLSPEHRESLAAALRGASRGAMLTRRLLAFARLQPLEPKTIDLNRFVVGVIDTLTRVLGATVSIESMLDAGLCLVSADETQLENAMLNLVLNARDAMPEGGKITIETANTILDRAFTAADEEVVPGQYAMIAVGDTGTGMTKAIRDRAFEPFFTTKEFGRGTGLGLSQVYGFIRQSGGHAKISSEPGEGTTVRFYLPRLPTDQGG
ncbi:MAG TPA: ATP-binding protein [Stellaceae bacterium]|nr:ATP-binding protein [Stellaceae bacterium]